MRVARRPVDRSTLVPMRGTGSQLPPRKSLRCEASPDHDPLGIGTYAYTRVAISVARPLSQLAASVESRVASEHERDAAATAAAAAAAAAVTYVRWMMGIQRERKQREKRTVLTFERRGASKRRLGLSL